MIRRKHAFIEGVMATGIGVAVVFAAFTYPTKAPAAKRVQTLIIRHNFDSGGLSAWQMSYPRDWQILTENSLHYLHMKRSRPPGVPRRPLQFALLKGVKVGSFDLHVKVRREGGSMIIVFNYVDTLHFYYVHLSVNSGVQEPMHNGVFIVDGGARRRISSLDAAPALPDHAWHEAWIVRDAHTGSIRIFMDNQTTPRFSVIDHTFTCGQIGLGSFDETGDFAEFRLRSHDAQCASAAKK